MLSIGGQNYYTRLNMRIPTIREVFQSALNGESLSPDEVICKKTIASSSGKIYNYADLILSHPQLEEIDKKLSGPKHLHDDYTEHSREQLEKVSILKRFLDQVAHRYDTIFIDCPASTHLTTQNAIFASDYYLVPALPDHLSTIGISGICNKIDLFNQQFAGLYACSNSSEMYRNAEFAGVIFNKYTIKNPTPSSRNTVSQHESPTLSLNPHTFPTAPHEVNTKNWRL